MNQDRDRPRTTKDRWLAFPENDSRNRFGGPSFAPVWIQRLLAAQEDGKPCNLPMAWHFVYLEDVARDRIPHGNSTVPRTLSAADSKS